MKTSVLRAPGTLRHLCALGTLASWLVAGGAGLVGNAWAGSIEIAPTKAELSARVRVALFTVRNTGEEETAMQLSLLRWPASDAMYAFAPSKDLQLTPRTFRLPSGAQQIVRIALRGAPPAQTEIAYRLIIEEVPILQEQDTTGMRLVVRHDLPVFVAPLAAPRRQLDMLIDCSPDGAGLHLRNLGNTHVKVLRVAPRDAASATPQGDWKTFEYLLPRGETWWLLSSVAPTALAPALSATVYTEQGDFPAEVQNSCR